MSSCSWATQTQIPIVMHKAKVSPSPLMPFQQSPSGLKV